MLIVVLFLALGVVVRGAGKYARRRSHSKEVKQMELASPAFRHRGSIPKEYTCDGKDYSPPLSWSVPPAGTKSFSLVMDDPDAPAGTWVHWVIYDLSAGERGLPKSVPRKPDLPDGAKQGTCWGVNSFSRVGYYGPCPPPGNPHRYSFRLYALDKVLGLAAKATKDRLESAMKGHVLATMELVGIYQR
jgi:hypothetical protein